MPPRKKVSTKDVQPSTIQETPVVFFLKLTDALPSDDVTPAGQSIEYSDISKPANVSYTEILKSMENVAPMNSELLKSILEKTVCESYTQDTACFWCCHKFDWAPAVLPISYDAYKNIYTCEGHYCSPECALSYLYKQIQTSDTVRWNRHTLLRDMYASMYKRRDLSMAPPRTLLRLFGGPLDIAQYRAYTSSVNDHVVSELPPIRLVFPTMNAQGPIRDIKKYVSLSSDTVEKASQQLRLKRSKPVHSNIQTLDMCLKAR
jgi:hypothetical protein